MYHCFSFLQKYIKLDHMKLLSSYFWRQCICPHAKFTYILSGFCVFYSAHKHLACFKEGFDFRYQIALWECPRSVCRGLIRLGSCALCDGLCQSLCSAGGRLPGTDPPRRILRRGNSGSRWRAFRFGGRQGQGKADELWVKLFRLGAWYSLWTCPVMIKKTLSVKIRNAESVWIQFLLQKAYALS